MIPLLVIRLVVLVCHRAVSAYSLIALFILDGIVPLKKYPRMAPCQTFDSFIFVIRVSKCLYPANSDFPDLPKCMDTVAICFSSGVHPLDRQRCVLAELRSGEGDAIFIETFQ